MIWLLNDRPDDDWLISSGLYLVFLVFAAAALMILVSASVVDDDDVALAGFVRLIDELAVLVINKSSRSGFYLIIVTYRNYSESNNI